MVEKSKISSVVLGASLLAFVAFVICILYINSEVLYTAHDRSEFLAGAPFFDTVMQKPFGLMQYVGAWLTQMFYYPALGASLLATIWVLIFYVGKKAFSLQGNSAALMLLPVAFLLTSIVDLGYWIYLLTIRGYWFSQSLAYLIMLILLWVARCTTPRKWHLAWYVAGVCLYPVLGWFALLFVICLSLTDKLTWRELLGIIMLVFTANIWHELIYSNQKLDDVLMAGLPRFTIPADSTPRLTTPFWMLGAVSILIPLCKRYLTKSFVPVLSVLASVVFVWSFMFKDKNYITEMRMANLAESDKWEEVLDIYAETPEHTTSMVMLKNIALMKEGGLLDYSFQIGNVFYPIYNPDSLHVSFLNIAAPVSYYNYGMVNEGFRLSFECAVPIGFSPYYLKILARSARANGEETVVNRYVNFLHHHPFYSDWNPEEPSATIIELKNSYTDEITGVENSDSYIVNSISYWNVSEGKTASEQALFYSMLRCDSRRFWATLRNYIKLHQGEEFPRHAQEAYIMYMDKAPEEKRMMLPVSQEIYDRYKDFWGTLEGFIRSGVKKEDIPGKMRVGFGDTFWYYNLFVHNYV